MIVRDLGLFLVADGVRACADPDSAAECALAALVRTVAAADSSGMSDEQRLRVAFRAANSAVLEHVRADRCRQGSLSTVAALWMRDRDVVLAHVGHSRISRIRAPGLTALTRDHTLANEHARCRPDATADEIAAVAAHANTLTRALGVSEEVTADISRHTPEKGDVYLLSTDGLHTTLPEHETHQIVMSSASVSQAAQSLVDRALELGAMDDTTCVLVRMA
jgi:protein phosphatase